MWLDVQELVFHKRAKKCSLTMHAAKENVATNEIEKYSITSKLTRKKEEYIFYQFGITLGKLVTESWNNRGLNIKVYSSLMYNISEGRLPKTVAVASWFHQCPVSFCLFCFNIINIQFPSSVSWMLYGHYYFHIPSRNKEEDWSTKLLSSALSSARTVRSWTGKPTFPTECFTTLNRT